MGTKPENEKGKNRQTQKDNPKKPKPNQETLPKHRHIWKKADGDKKRIKNRNKDKM